MTAAVRALRASNVKFAPHLYDYQERGGTKHSADALGVDEHFIIKTLVMEDENNNSMLVLMHGDMEVSTQKLARQLNVKRIAACSPETATKHTGYQVGGISLFGTRNKLPIYVERSIFDLPCIYINGGKRGFLVEIAPSDMKRVLKIEEVEVSS